MPDINRRRLLLGLAATSTAAAAAAALAAASTIIDATAAPSVADAIPVTRTKTSLDAMLLELKGAKPKRVQVDPEPEPEADRVWRARYWGNLSVSDDELERRYGAPTWAVLCYPTHAEWIEDDARLTRLAQDGRLASPTARQDAREPHPGP
ncbi:MAG: hypothetical protein EOR30_34075 [Mesorhizobium sp.]|uniref:hypothetical protein n=2 Tax=Mesorhizobium TaxID=68287 RepID=UPI000FCAF9A1|nr:MULTISPECIES: hypothetical protein [unclassified Mesorhizobium]RUV66182.1 hypothetical protein EOA78_35160 [Mesorhizobium sp. M5C.F.Cr.IN.023.01.1.1]RWF87397.1 MAG: hypothetical protein EOQ45_33390 [Mesorhizobium sp.]RWI41163.1 MAG: hypothetical protein EOR14_12425 [Mesorhizobium sp.]RWI68929.1 MAG: hypothetical protein EOR17_11315 [Mesorhizobium sp.]RWI81327.1 MAG: hypothetical protein EOR20_33175 [Mesorhizobium sp.]